MPRKAPEPPTPEPGTDPRIERSLVAGRAAALELLLTEGWDAVTHQRVAQRAGLSRTTVYRHWPGRVDLLREAIVMRGLDESMPLKGDLQARLTTALNSTRRQMADQHSYRLLAAIVDRSAWDEEVERVKTEMVARQVSVIRRILIDARAEGVLPPDLDVNESLSVLVGPLTYRRLITSEPVTPHFVEVLISNFLRVHGA